MLILDAVDVISAVGVTLMVPCDCTHALPHLARPRCTHRITFSAGDEDGGPAIAGAQQFAAIHQHFMKCGTAAKCILLSTYCKMQNLYPELRPAITPIFEAHTTVIDAELQQVRTMRKGFHWSRSMGLPHRFACFSPSAHPFDATAHHACAARCRVPALA